MQFSHPMDGAAVYRNYHAIAACGGVEWWWRHGSRLRKESSMEEVRRVPEAAEFTAEISYKEHIFTGGMVANLKFIVRYVPVFERLHEPS